jgi:hypothetical protein
MKAAKSMKVAKSKKTAKRTKSTSPAARRAKPATSAQKRLADVTRYKTDMEKRRARLSGEIGRGPTGAEVRLLAFPRLRFFLVTEPHTTTLLDLIRAHVDEDIARAARVIEAFGLGRDMLSEQADELKIVLAHVKKTMSR